MRASRITGSLLEEDKYSRVGTLHNPLINGVVYRQKTATKDSGVQQFSLQDLLEGSGLEAVCYFNPAVEWESCARVPPYLRTYCELKAYV